MRAQSVSYYNTDFGAVKLRGYALALPRTKRGDFDKRYKKVRDFIRDINKAAQDRYMSSRTGFLQVFP